MAIQQQQIKPQTTKIRNKETRPKKNTIENGRRIYKKGKVRGVDYILQISSRILDPSGIFFIFLSFSFSTLRNNNSSQALY